MKRSIVVLVVLAAFLVGVVGGCSAMIRSARITTDPVTDGVYLFEAFGNVWEYSEEVI